MVTDSARLFSFEDLDPGLIKKASRIQLVGTDIDGVWTDARMYYSTSGDVIKGYSTYDGYGVSLLRQAGIPTVIMTGENCETVRLRAEKLRIEWLYMGETEKLKRLQYLCTRLNIPLSKTAYIGDDLNDLETLAAVGLSAMPPNSPVLNQFTPDFITTRSGGNGAFRDLSDLILYSRNNIKTL